MFDHVLIIATTNIRCHKEISAMVIWCLGFVEPQYNLFQFPPK